MISNKIPNVAIQKNKILPNKVTKGNERPLHWKE
jgi:hypothetical protein